mmetsp:Transcript_29702/g.34177  ORF Transcript_29702/g.34177 Transcript_29702/m.34177 type:complete len:607 (-) Transcript_29702:156-1976(-)
MSSNVKSSLSMVMSSSSMITKSPLPPPSPASSSSSSSSSSPSSSKFKPNSLKSIPSTESSKVSSISPSSPASMIDCIASRIPSEESSPVANAGSSPLSSVSSSSSISSLSSTSSKPRSNKKLSPSSSSSSSSSFKSGYDNINNKDYNGPLGFGLGIDTLEQQQFAASPIKKQIASNLQQLYHQGQQQHQRRSSGSGSGSGGPDANADAKVNAATNASENANATPLNIENDMESFQNAVLDLFRHIQSKDVFEAFYRVDLAKRLLLNKSASIDVERTFVSKLKGECGTGYTSKMEGMFKDMELSREVMNNYSVYLGGLEDVSSGTYSSVSDVGVDMDVQVLTTGYWPSHPQHPSLILPTALEAKKNHFQSYYNSKYQGRRVAWQNSLGNCIVRAQFPKMSSPRELNVSLCQALVLMCFNVEDGGLDVEVRYTINDIMKKTGIADRGEAERVLQSLSMGRDGTQVLRRIEENKTVSKDADKISMTPKKKHKGTRRAIYDSDVFVVNANFTSNQRRIRITNIQMKETSEERVKTHEAVTLDRLYLIDAAIVRIMKARKTLDHRGLVGEVMIQLKFPASGVDIKKRIETLIEREYLQRVEGDLSRYNYLA